ncbi:polysaccharide deacetylase family protein [Chondromyces apiculatus]|uniref:NodB homology domain-containing protein n=1 Tax=Chondromyces apiculatus DSM 436 TaxID=1192034 RepID=A0A017T6C2_9BACT|nr:polysaccharide deacetylase family protein [Chondromyces apiculatus]EYF04823.1 Hypothetical protein CAP_3849 [Chondromyces apiculatus DSM 436]
MLRTARDTLRETVARGLHRSGLSTRLRRAQERGRVATLLVYHDPSPEVLDAHLRFLCQHYDIVPLDAVVDALHRRDWSALPPRPLVLTIDDGHRGNAALADVLRAHGVRATIYACSALVGTHRHFWWTHAGKRAHAFIELSQEDRLAALAALGVDPEEEHPSPQALSRDEMERLRPWVDFGSHTRTHPILPHCDAPTARQEIQASRAEIRALTGAPCDHFCFPNGDFSPRDLDLVRQAGYRSARTTRVGRVDETTDPFVLPAIGVGDGDSIDVLALRLATFYGVLGSSTVRACRHMLRRWTRSRHAAQAADPRRPDAAGR